jgi:hypothetical protein
MTAIYCTRGADGGRSLSLELEVLETDVAGRRGFDKQHRIDRWKGKCAGVGTEGALDHTQLVLLWSSGSDRLASGLGRRAGDRSSNLKGAGDA